MATATITKTVGSIRYEYDRDMDSQGYTLFVYNAETGQLLSSAATNRRDDGGTFQAAGQALIDEAISRLRTQNNPLAAEAIAYLSSQGRSDIAELDRQYDALFPPPPATPTITNTEAPATTDPAGNNALQGAASDDSGAQPTTPASTVTQATTGETSAPGTSDSPSINAPEQPGAERETPAPENESNGLPPYENEMFVGSDEPDASRPGTRLKNPLSFMSSYNYQLSLYVVTPDAYDAFLASGRKNINVFNTQIGNSVAAEEANRRGGAFLLAQSGGAGPDPRAPGVNYDYYIDNLSFTHMSTSESTGAPTGNIEFKFQIIEPYGFSFVNNLKNIQKEFDNFAKGAEWGSAESKIVSVPIAKQFFLLGIRFYGWDKFGRQVTGSEIFDNGGQLDPDADGTGAVFETFYELLIDKLKYKIDGKATVYDLEGNVTGANLGSNIKKGHINAPVEVVGNTVRDILSGESGLFTKLNKIQQTLKENGTIEYPITYKVEWLGPAAQIALASMTSKARAKKENQPASEAKNTNEVNDSTETKSSPNNTRVPITLDNQPIIQAIDTLLSRSSYIEDAVAFNYTDADQFDPETNSKTVAETPEKIIRWYRITPKISNINWDTKTSDWAYDITYSIETYKMPIIDSPFVVNTDKYYGPHKRYDYWYTGENSEVLSYTQELNNQYYTEVPAGDPKAKNTASDEGNAGKAASVPDSTKNIDLSTAGGGLDTAATGAIRNVLYDPGSYTNAKIQILGDPDFLMQENGAGIAGLSQAYNRHYEANGYTIRPTGGQVFIEIDFKEPIDYSFSGVSEVNADGEGITGVGGTLSINDSILFWDYPPGAKDVIKGISYRVISVQNSFRNGLFTQTIDAIINDFGRGAAKTDQSREGNSGSGAGDGSGTALSEEDRRLVGEARDFTSKGTAQDPAAGTGKAPKIQPKPEDSPEPNT